MAKVSLTCGACQGTVQVSDRLPNNSRIHCPACGNKFVYTRAATPTAGPVPSPSAPVDSAHAPQPLNSDAAETDLWASSPPQGLDNPAASYQPPPAHPQLPAYGGYAGSHAGSYGPAATDPPATRHRGFLFGAIGVGAAIMLIAFGVLGGSLLYFGWQRFGRPNDSQVAANSPPKTAAADDEANVENIATIPAESEPSADETSAPGITPLPPGVAEARVTTQSPLRYKWQVGKSYRCSFDVSFGQGSKLSKYSGTTVYTPTTTDPRSVAADVEEAEEQEGSGTAFVVHPQGVLVTCAHVVEGASEVSVVLDGRPVPARVIDLNRRKDLALLRIDVEDLPFLAMGDSAAVRLAEPIRVVGFPLTDMLGESIKVASGEVSGIIDRKSNKMLQIDATVNPGNSGGPVVDSWGNVVGVASALLAGSDISAMGFAVPAEDVAAMLLKNRVPMARPVRGEELSGPDLAESVTPAVLLVKVKLGGAGAADARRVIRYQGRITSGSSGANKSETGQLVLDPYGEITHSSGKIELPAMMGQLGGIGLEALPSDASDTWQQMRMSAVTRLKQASPSPIDRFRSPYRPGSPFDPRGRTSPYGRRRRPPIGLPSSGVKVEVYPAVELVEYEIGDDKGDTIEIKKSNHLTTIHDDGEATFLDVEGNGTIVFDKVRGMPRTMDYQGMVKMTEGGRTSPVPFTIKYRFQGPG